MAQLALRVTQIGGTVETGAAEHWQAIRKIFPEAKFITLRRPIEEVMDSFARKGWQGQELEAELVRRERALDELEQSGEATRVFWRDLDDVHCASWLCQWLLGGSLDFPRWEVFQTQRLEIPFEARMKYLAENALAIDALRMELRMMPNWHYMGRESWASMAQEGIALGQQHFTEANPDVPDWYRFAPNDEAMQAANANGTLMIWTYRLNCRLLGYVSFTLELDPETGHLVANQGPWFMVPGHGKHGLALMREALRDLRANTQVRQILFHHPVHGRGAKLGKVFERLGAREAQRRYVMFVRPDDAQH